MNNNIHPQKSGISLVDNNWGGFYQGGIYLLSGPHRSGKTILSLQYAKECVQQKEVCLFFTTLRPKYLTISAASIDFDLQQYMNQNAVILVRVALPKNLEDKENSDNYLSEYMSELVELIEQYKPSKIVFDEFTPFVEFKNIDNLKESFSRTLESIEELNVTSLFVISEPVTNAAKEIVDAISPFLTGTISLEREEKNFDYYGGFMTAKPNFGHTEGTFTSQYILEPKKGIVSEIKEVSNEPVTTVITTKLTTSYEKLSELKIDNKEPLDFNFYSIEEFKLILNNQIAYSNTSNEKSAIVSLKMSQELETSRGLLFNVVKNIIRLSIGKKDKVCSYENYLIILVPRATDEDINNLLNRIKTNMANFDSFYKISDQVFYKTLFLDSSIKNSEDIFETLSLNK
jgi:KaiC/GvpD/RAD55 family RecA-like ATPase